MFPCQGIYFVALSHAMASRWAKVGVCHLGVCRTASGCGRTEGPFSRVGFDLDAAKVDMLIAGESYLGSIRSDIVRKAAGRDLFHTTNDRSRLAECGIIIVRLVGDRSRHSPYPIPSSWPGLEHRRQEHARGRGAFATSSIFIVTDLAGSAALTTRAPRSVPEQLRSW